MTDAGSLNPLPPLDGRTGIVDSGGRPTPSFQRMWNNQRAINAAGGSVTLGSGAPTSTNPGDGAEYVDISTTPFTLYVGSAKGWHQTGAKVFTDLSDVPSSYTSSTHFILRVNSADDGLEFVSVSSILDQIGSTEGDILYRGTSAWTVLAPGTSGDVLQTNGSGTAPTWVTPSGGGGGGYEIGNPTPPLGTLTPFNQHVSVLTPGTYSSLISFHGSNSGFESYEENVPGTTPYDVVCRLHVGTDANNWSAGIVLRNSTTGLAVTLGQYEPGTSTPGVLFQNWNNANSTASTPYAQTWQPPPPQWMRIHNDGTNIQCYVSYNGSEWQAIYSETLSSFVGSVNRAGVFVYPISSGSYQTAFFSWFGTTLP